MSDYERGICYARYRKEVHRQQMLEQKIYGIIISIGAIVIQAVTGMFEIGLFTAWMLVAGMWLIVSKKNYLKETQG